MAGLLATAVIAVSVNVVNPAASTSPVPHWTAPAQATLGSVVEQWAAEAGQPKPTIDPAVATYKVGNLTLVAQDYCAATAKLVGALSHAQTRPALKGCGSASAPLVIAAADTAVR